ncbi:ATP/GTP-binding protein [Streptomyces sp. NBC_01445]|uniref:ATP/GTP-binding protein n=1 Tax=Streptomyces sp. NBC_01445 TaxID=2903869 RepID=UPI002DDA38C0|nr:ATP/GTP-binding protein [Streptomyces sp. NBC_01445]WSE02017.1 ATP/GTP-binding protein [Streptomyces sp. NBC_01445]WSE10313.1 ATP/GTP-binding protein [Streptomyces sp. NBC_01445]WSE11119.1 ATP/GTP-binding protein [Streptomyces sp. NBC_01445]
MLVVSSSAAHADGGPAVGNDPGCRGAAPDVTVCASDPVRAPGKSDSQSAAAKGGGKGSAAPKCIYTKMVPQPPAENLAMQDGKKRGGKGAAYQVMCPGTGRIGVVWIPDGNAPGAPAIDPEVVARQAVDSMKLVGPDIDINPKPGGKGLVGMPVWMAVGQSPNTYGPNSATATAGGVTVTATAKVKSIVWNMGDGTSVTCNGPGTGYRKSFGMKQSPDCGHVYKQTSDSAGGKFKVSATATWAVDWQVAGGGGETGHLTEVRNSQVGLTITESQAVN